MAASLRNIKALLSGGDFLDKCAENPDTSRGVLKLLSLLSLDEVPVSVARLVIEFEAFFTRFSRDLSNAQSKKSQRVQLREKMDLEWDHSLTREKKANQLHSQRQSHTEHKASLDEQKSLYQAQIMELQRKKAEIDEKKALLDLVEGLPSQEVVDQEAQAGITHAKQALALQKNVDQLDHSISKLDARLVYEKELFAEFLGKFPI